MTTLTSVLPDRDMTTSLRDVDVTVSTTLAAENWTTNTAAQMTTNVPSNLTFNRIANTTVRGYLLTSITQDRDLTAPERNT